ncbi:MAG: hypothetical protein M3R24_09095, partial [Chloroflexota bacterium]|nr:hypothetical protein [Chloroflexota bacterium]
MNVAKIVAIFGLASRGEVLLVSRRTAQLGRWAAVITGQSHHFWYTSGMEIYDGDAVSGVPAVGIMEHFSQIDDPRRE